MLKGFPPHILINEVIENKMYATSMILSISEIGTLSDSDHTFFVGAKAQPTSFLPLSLCTCFTWLHTSNISFILGIGGLGMFSVRLGDAECDCIIIHKEDAF